MHIGNENFVVYQGINLITKKSTEKPSSLLGISSFFFRSFSLTQKKPKREVTIHATERNFTEITEEHLPKTCLVF